MRVTGDLCGRRLPRCDEGVRIRAAPRRARFGVHERRVAVRVARAVREQPFTGHPESEVGFGRALQKRRVIIPCLLLAASIRVAHEVERELGDGGVVQWVARLARHRMLHRSCDAVRVGSPAAQDVVKLLAPRRKGALEIISPKRRRRRQAYVPKRGCVIPGDGKNHVIVRRAQGCRLEHKLASGEDWYMRKVNRGFVEVGIGDYLAMEQARTVLHTLMRSSGTRGVGVVIALDFVVEIAGDAIRKPILGARVVRCHVHCKTLAGGAGVRVSGSQRVHRLHTGEAQVAALGRVLDVVVAFARMNCITFCFPAVGVLADTALWTEARVGFADREGER
mmetsp:Transcript_15144/g.34763  ORF Transcript_15144/g.34763 Transcript_15144/m.34763 type:complete len:336 (-) Transcript_15144:270-1277(-)